MLKDKTFYTLHGKTGVGKTAILEALRSLGHQIIHLEEIAQHRGSVFGKMSRKQPKREEFFEIINSTLNQFNNFQAIYIEWKGTNIGSLKIPKELLESMKRGKHILLKRSLEGRIKQLVEVYKDSDPKNLYESLFLLKPRMQIHQFAIALKALDENKLNDFILAMLSYYDKSHNYNTHAKDYNYVFDCSSHTNINVAQKLIEVTKKLNKLN